MKIFDRVNHANLENRELQLSIFVSVTVTLLAMGMAVLMYPIVFSHQTPGDRTLRIAFFGYCALCVLLGLYLWDRHATIRRLLPPDGRGCHRQIVETRRQASVELLQTMPEDFGSFPGPLAHGISPDGHDHSKTLHRRDCRQIPGRAVQPFGKYFGARRCREGHRSKAARAGLHLHFGSGLFGSGVTGSGSGATRSECAVASLEGLADAAGVSHRFQFELTVVNYPVHARPRHTELQQAVSALVSMDDSMQGMAEAVR